MVERLILALVALAFSCDLSAAQNTRTGLDAYINSTFTANGKNAISGPQINTVLNAMTTSSGFLGDTNTWTGSNTFTGPFAMPAGAAFVNLGYTLTAPASSSATCSPGQQSYDGTYVYLCTATNTWGRALTSDFSGNVSVAGTLTVGSMAVSLPTCSPGTLTAPVTAGLAFTCNGMVLVAQ